MKSERTCSKLNCKPEIDVKIKTFKFPIIITFLVEQHSSKNTIYKTLSLLRLPSYMIQVKVEFFVHVLKTFIKKWCKYLHNYNFFFLSILNVFYLFSNNSVCTTVRFVFIECWYWRIIIKFKKYFHADFELEILHSCC